MKKTLLTLFVLINVSMHAQENHLQNPLKFQIGFNNYTRLYVDLPVIEGLYSYWGPMFNLNYSFSKHFELGGSVGYLYYPEEQSNDFINHIHKLYYGFNGYYHLSPYFMKKNVPKFDLYIKGSLGAESLLHSDVEPSQTTYFNYGGSVGVAYYPWSRLGFCGEFGLGARAIKMSPEIIRSIAQFGVSYKFGK